MMSPITRQQDNQFQLCCRSACDLERRSSHVSDPSCSTKGNTQQTSPRSLGLWWLGFTLFLLTLTSPMLDVSLGLMSHAGAASLVPTVEVTRQEGLDGQADVLTLKTREATLSQILQAMSETVGFKTTIYGKLSSRPLTRSFTAQPLSHILNDILYDQNWAMLYTPSQTQHSQSLPGKLWVYGKTSTALSSSQSFWHQEVRAQGWEDVTKSRSTPPTQVDSPYNRDKADSETARHAHVLAHDKDPAKRAKAVIELEYIGGEAAVKALEIGLGDLSAAVRVQVIHSLDYLQAESAIPSFGQMLYGDADPKVRLAAVQALAKQRSEIVPGFLKAATKDKDETVRTTAMRALGRWQ